MANTDADIEAWLAAQEAELTKRPRRRMPTASPEMLAALEASQALPVEDARVDALQAIASGEMPTGTPNAALVNALTSMASPVAPTPAPSERTAREPLPTPMELRRQPATQDLELEALADLRAAQSGAQRAEALLPYLQAAQQFTAALGRTKYDPSGVQAIAAVTRAKEQDAAARLKAAQEFAKRRMTESQFERLMGTKEAAAERQAALTSEQLEIRRQAEERMLEAEARRMEAEKRRMQAEERRGRAGPKPVDEITQRKRELEVQKLERELAGTEGAQLTPKQQKQAYELEVARQRATGEDPKKVKAAEASATNIIELLNELRALYKQHGPQKFGPEARRMQQLSRMIAIEAKGEGMAALGALSGPDQTILEQIQGAQPTELFANTFGLADPLEAMDQMEMWVKTRMNTARKIYGPTGTQAAPKSQFPMVVRDRQTGQRYTINSREEAERLSAIADRLDVVQ